MLAQAVLDALKKDSFEKLLRTMVNGTGISLVDVCLASTLAFQADFWSPSGNQVLLALLKSGLTENWAIFSVIGSQMLGKLSQPYSIEV